MMRNALVLISALLLTYCSNPVKQTNPAAVAEQQISPTVLLISIDGFRYNYFDKNASPNLSQLASEGVKAEWMTPIFPSMTFPNHYSIVTGMYAEHHGIVNNSMYDPEFKANFSMGNAAEVKNGRWWGGEPLWVTAEKQGQKSATFFWPGSEAEIAGKRPSYLQPYDVKIPNNARVDTVLSWLDKPKEQRPTFLTLYFSKVDDAGHHYGPDSPQLIDAIQSVDSTIGYLIAGLKARKLFNQVNMLVVSDHGMTALSPERVIYLDDYIDSTQVDRINWGVVTGIWPQAGREDSVYRRLQSQSHPSMQVYRKANIPARYHYQQNRRIAPILCVAESGWTITSRKFAKTSKSEPYVGTHGYDNQTPDMRAIFIAHGPAFREGFVAKPFCNIHLYSLMAKILGLTPAANDGRLDSIKTVLRKQGVVSSE
ncbi:MAG: ectonucleotide pyrophosphatase/phosphodiesterase [Bacteroidota bacterium]